jgi:D-lyxose ketol-isomerase
MNRSHVNHIVAEAQRFVDSFQFALPPFAQWSLADWQRHLPDADEIVAHRLGWDITDFGAGDFARFGLVLFTLRNGALANLQSGKGKLYCEKLLICQPDQMNPLHYHWTKVEDIINRGGGDFVLELFNGNADGSRDEQNAVRVKTDGLWRSIPAGGQVRLRAGESITLEPYCYHRFWAERAPVLVGEVSLVNDDLHDNCFFEPVGRFPQIEDDVAPERLLVCDYERYLRDVK